jgi:hypothetical protein
VSMLPKAAVCTNVRRSNFDMANSPAVVGSHNLVDFVRATLARGASPQAAFIGWTSNPARGK